MDAVTVAGKAWSRDKVGPRPVPLTPDPDLGIADPAKGERVPRCDECGTPDVDGNRVIAGRWQVGSIAFVYRLCEREIRRRAPFDPRSGDPLQVPS